MAEPLVLTSGMSCWMAWRVAQTNSSENSCVIVCAVSSRSTTRVSTSLVRSTRVGYTPVPIGLSDRGTTLQPGGRVGPPEAGPRLPRRAVTSGLPGAERSPAADGGGAVAAAGVLPCADSVTVFAHVTRLLDWLSWYSTDAGRVASLLRSAACALSFASGCLSKKVVRACSSGALAQGTIRSYVWGAASSATTPFASSIGAGSAGSPTSSYTNSPCSLSRSTRVQ
mmetsp:Transcript_37215/g.109838  ORF Transcript_37215/g.109838 Transcript_37215/m.109838 type:complete len:225 (-) Transcript_37215:1619-2293(-)